ncbi:MAG: hypothetical protein DRI86_01715 [Bacteroidetes bacterium]|nr:MAG: hypothetical protein DRI86_01715 [Bacteroidota bacterium]
MLRKLQNSIAKIYDPIEKYWDGENNQRIIGTILVFSFLISLLLIHLNILGYIPDIVSQYIATNHYAAINVAFVVLLSVEVISLIFSLPKSLARSVQKQFEIISLILLRNAFKEFSNFSEPIDWSTSYDTIFHILSDSISAILVFLGIYLIRRVRVHHSITTNDSNQENFKVIKKVISVMLMIAFLFLAIQDSYMFFTHSNTFKFFPAFYNILIYTDILMVLVSLRYSYRYRVLFRNSGFALATVLLRLSLSAPVYFNAAIAVFSVAFVYMITLIYQQMRKRDL